MFLSKESSGIYYLFFFDELNKRHKVSTRSKYKSDALKFLQSFRLLEHERKTNLKRVRLSEFRNTYIEYSKSVHTRKSTANCQTALKEFERVIGDHPIHVIGVREIELFLATKKREASVWTARKYYIAIASAFETAKRWGNILSNPVRLVQIPKVPELQPLFFSRSELTALFQTITDKDLHEIVFTAVSTGLRLGEIVSLEWQAVDLQRKVIAVRNTDKFVTKNGKGRMVPLTDGFGGCYFIGRRNIAMKRQLYSTGRESSTTLITLLRNSSGM
jgi:integrase